MPKEYLTLDDFDLGGKTVLVRVDINSPIAPTTGEILDDTRIRHHIRTLERLADSKIVLMAHQSRPGKKDFTSMNRHAQRLSQGLHKKVTFIDDFFGSRALGSIKNMKNGEVLLLENTRFYAEEHVLKNKDYSIQAESHLVSHLAKLGDFFVNDAFAAAHRSQPSLTGFTETIPCLAGVVMDREIHMLETAMKNTQRPSIAILGGIKVFDSLKVMWNMLANNIVDKVLTTGVVGNIFLMARGYDLGEPTRSFLERELGGYLELMESAMELDKEYEGRIEAPTDLVLNDTGIRRAVQLNDLPVELQIFDIGLDTAVNYRRQILDARNIILNGPAGVFEIEEFAVGTTIIYNAIAESEGFSVIGGGETVAAARNLHLEEKVNHISTGGGACINFLSGKDMPAIEALKHSRKLFEEGHYKC